MAADTSALEGHLNSLQNDYYDLVFPGAFKVDEPPSVVDAVRMVGKSHPMVIKGYSPLAEGRTRDWHDLRTYIELHGERPVTIACTDDGLADSVRVLDSGEATFVKPHEQVMTMADFLSRIHGDEVLYLQSQDGNVYRSEPGMRDEPELASFQSAFVPDIPWMREATGGQAEAVNIWIGTSRSVTSFHHDPYENIYHVLSGSKTFTLLSPIDGLSLNQRFYSASTLVRNAEGQLVPQPDHGAPEVPWVQSLAVPGSVRPIIVTVEEGETLYLPAEWWHKVEQSEGSGGVAVAVNYWYPAEIRPERYALLRFAQRVAGTAGRMGVIPPPGDDDVDSEVWGDDSAITSEDEWDPGEWGR